MSWFRNLKIRIKLLSCFIILAIFTGVVGLVGINAVKNVNESSQRMYHNNFVPSQDLQVCVKYFTLIFYLNPLFFKGYRAF